VGCGAPPARLVGGSVRAAVDIGPPGVMPIGDPFGEPLAPPAGEVAAPPEHAATTHAANAIPIEAAQRVRRRIMIRFWHPPRSKAEIPTTRGTVVAQRGCPREARILRTGGCELPGLFQVASLTCLAILSYPVFAGWCWGLVPVGAGWRGRAGGSLRLVPLRVPGGGSCRVPCRSCSRAGPGPLRGAAGAGPFSRVPPDAGRRVVSAAGRAPCVAWARGVKCSSGTSARSWSGPARMCRGRRRRWLRARRRWRGRPWSRCRGR
jgi:hypothetical protein